MPDARLERTRRAYDDARLVMAERRWRSLHENAGEQLRARAVWGGPCPGCRTAAECRAFGLNCQRYLAEHLQAPAAVDPHGASNTGTPTPREKDVVPFHWNVIDGGDH